ncbi:hypothetical protein, partial [Pseudomonas lundensis]|uniref:hypothetical protein n=1 Tax=Pseudomonas lundensis TaxID=86185 RepID=UPI001CA3A87A
MKNHIIMAMGQLKKKTSSITSLINSGEKSFRSAKTPLIIGKPKAMIQAHVNGAPKDIWYEKTWGLPPPKSKYTSLMSLIYGQYGWASVGRGNGARYVLRPVIKDSISPACGEGGGVSGRS